MDVVEILFATSFWAAAIRIATPLIFGVLGALICERSGVLNLGIEGIFVAGAMAGWMAVWLGFPLWGGVMVAALTGAVVNAGVGAAAPLAGLDFAEWRRVMAVNLDGAFLTLKTALAAMDEGGSALVTASATGLKPVPMTAAYGTSKAAVIHLARIAAAEVAQRGIRVNAIAPGGVDTAIWDAMLDPAKNRGEQMAAMATGVPPGRFATPDEVAAQIAFLMSDDAATIPGSVLTADGGFTL